MVSTVLSSFANNLRSMASFPLARALHSVCTSTAQSTLLNTNSLALMPVRTNVRCHFPRPNERMRIKKHGYKKRLTTTGGLRVLMRRILRGRHVISH